jgi:hypothetical protein
VRQQTDVVLEAQIEAAPAAIKWGLPDKHVGITHFLSARKADLKKGFQHLVVLVVLVVGTRVKKRF